MCVKITSEELTAKEDIIVYKIVRLYEDNFVSRFRTYERSIQYSYEEKEIQFGDGKILTYKIGVEITSNFITSPGLYVYAMLYPFREYYISEYECVLKCIIPKGTKYKFAKEYSYPYKKCILTETLIPIEKI